MLNAVDEDSVEAKMVRQTVLHKGGLATPVWPVHIQITPTLQERAESSHVFFSLGPSLGDFQIDLLLHY